MDRKGNKSDKCIYVYEFPDNHAYVGLTYDIESRQKNRDRSKNDTVKNYIIETGLQPIRKQLTDYIPVEEAIRMEKFFHDKYKSDGWLMLNKVKTGAIGGNIIKWTKEACTLEALKYKTKIEFRNKSSSAYTTAKRKRWINDICQHMTITKKPNNYYTKEVCMEICQKYDTFSKLSKEHPCCYAAMYRNNWIDELTLHMSGKKIKPNNYWNFNNCLEVAKTCKTIKEFKEKEVGAYDWIRKHKLSNEFYKQVNFDLKPYQFWTIDKCREEALKFFSRSEYIKKSGQSYRIAKRNGWLDYVCEHMIKKEKPTGFWNDKNHCFLESIKYKTRNKFKFGCSGAYRSSIKHNWIDEFFPILKK